MGPEEGAVGAQVGVFPGEDGGDVILLHAGGDHRLHPGPGLQVRIGAHGLGLLDQFEQGHRRFFTALFGDAGQGPAGVGRFRHIDRDEDALREGELGDHEAGLLEIGEVPIRKHHGQGGLPVRVGIDVQRDVYPGGPGLFQPAEETGGFAPEALERQFGVRDLDGHSGLRPDPDDLFHRVPKPAIFAPDVADVAAAGIGGNPREFQNLLRSGVNPGVVLQAGTQPERSRGQIGFQQGFHRGDFFRRRFAPEILAHHQLPQRVVAGVAGDVDGGRGRFETAPEVGERVRRATVLPHDQGGDSLAHGRGGVESLEQIGGGVAVGVDEPRRKDEPSRLEHGVPGPRGNAGTDLGDPSVHNADRARIGGVAGAVHNPGVRDREPGGADLAANRRKGNRDPRHYQPSSGVLSPP